MPSVKKCYMQQLICDGLSYTQGHVVDLLKEWKIGVRSFPFKYNAEAKDIASRDWKGEDGVESYIPAGGLPLKDYDVEVDFLYSGTKDDAQADIRAFLDFLYGRNENGLSGRLAVYDEHVGEGRKDVHVVSIDNELWWNEDCDDEFIATFKVKFHVDDPATQVTLETNASGEVTGMNLHQE